MKTTGLAGLVMVAGLAFTCSNEEEVLTLGTPASFKNLRLIPIRANTAFHEHHRSMGHYLTLKEATDAGQVAVTELHLEAGRHAETMPAVNTLFIENLSSDTVFILNGETVTGGQQDRMIAQDVVLLPHSGKIDLSVFCVGQNRWSGDGDFKITEQSLPPPRVRQASQSEDQFAVWDEVAVALDISVTESPSSSVSDIKMNQRFIERQSPYVEALQSAFDNDPSIIGIIAVANGRILGTDAFATHALFFQHYPNLLQSYASEALFNDEPTQGPPSLDSYWQEVMTEMKAVGFLLEGVGRKKSAHFAKSGAGDRGPGAGGRGQ